ncbi:hypothetical protein K439DRAFT_1613137 [Ramaria rubella]|nr:hypothetical protein K439DRAFT_1613137 [Ramaria rubella]
MHLFLRKQSHSALRCKWLWKMHRATFNENEGAGLEDEELLVTGMGEVEFVPPVDPRAHTGNKSTGTAADGASPSCPSKPPTGNRAVCACFGWKRTHIEELCVASCGMILGQGTFYGSEGPNGVRYLSPVVLEGALSNESVPSPGVVDGHELH